MIEPPPVHRQGRVRIDIGRARADKGALGGRLLYDGIVRRFVIGPHDTTSGQQEGKKDEG